MANNEFTIPIPARLKNVAKGGHVAGAEDIIDDALGKEQSEINQERIDDIAEVKGGSTKSIADISEDIANEAERASGIEAGLRESIDELGQIGLDPDNAISTNGDDFDGDTTAKRSKIPTIGAIIDGNPGVYDVSKRNPTGGPNSDGKFTLEYILENANTLIPTSRRHSGMEICFVHSSDNKYVQFRLMAQSFTADTTQWAIADEGVYVENPEFIYVKTDKDGKILWAIKADGGIYYGAGVPQQVIDYITEKIAELSLDEYEDIVAFLNGLEEGDKTLQILLNEKVDKVEGKSLIDSEYASTKSTVDSPEFLDVALDAEDKVLEGIKADGTKVIGGDLEVGGSANISANIRVLGNMELSGVSYKVIENPEYLAAWVDIYDKVIFGLKADGKTYVGDADFLNDIENIKSFIKNITDKNIDWDALSSITVIENPEYIEAKTDSEGKLLAGRTNDGAAFESVGFSAPKVSIGGTAIENIQDPEGRTEIKIDSDGRILSYRDSDGMTHENVGIVADSGNFNHLNLTSEGMTEFQQALKDSGFNPDGTGDWSDYLSEDGDKPLCIPIPRGAAVLNIISNVNLSNLTKSITPGAIEGVTYDVHAEVEYYDMDGNYFKKPVLMSGQGTSSMAYPKKNFAFDFFDSEIDGDAFKIKFGDWVPQDSFHLKAYYTDAFRCIGLATYKLYDEMVKTRGVFNDYVYKRALIDFSKIGYVSNGYNDINDTSLQYETGAKCFPDGFPVIVYQNGNFWGIYCWQIKKHRDNYHMKKSNGKHIHLDGVINNSTLFGGTIDWNANTGFEVRNPKDLYLMDGTKYDADTNSGELIDSTSQYYDSNNSKHVTTAAVKQRIIDLSGVINTLTAAKTAYDASSKTAEDLATLKETFETYFDVKNLIDYLIVSDITRNYDGFSKNWQWLTYDGVKWFIGLYDCDGCFGGNFTGTSLILPPSSGGHITGWLMFTFIINYYSDELKAKYKELRDKEILTADNITGIVRNILDCFGEQNIDKEFKKWTNCPCNRDTVVNENWEFDLDGNGNPQMINDPTDPNMYDNTRTYNVGDSCYYAQYPFNGEAIFKYKAKATVTGIQPVDVFGYRDNIYRLYNWIYTSIANMDSLYNYNN